MLYLTAFLGIIILGDIVLIPTVYLGVTGALNLPFVIAIAVFANLVCDMLCYSLGYHLGAVRISTLPVIGKNIAMWEKISTVFKAHVVRIVFLSQFVHGTRVPVQILCGAYRMRYLTYMLASLGGAFAWSCTLALCIYLASASLGSMESNAHSLRLGIGLALIFGFALQFIIAKLIRRFWTFS